MADSLTYVDAGVNIEKANKLVESIREIAKKTMRPGVIGEIGGFGGLFSINTTNLQKPVLVSSTDGVGTKLKVAFMMGKHDTVGIDLVAMSVNDIIVQGAEPLFFLDYFATGELDTGIAADVITGIAEGCKQAKCALLGGETAEMPGFYKKNEYDLAGFAVGIVDYDKIIDGSDIRMGHNLIGIASSGLHSNGYSLARKICFDVLKLKTDSYVPELGKTIGEELITPTRIYSEIILSFLKELPIHGLAHITGGGLSENIIRIIPETCMVRIIKESWEVPPVFHFLKEAGNISEEEMMKTFNNGIGMVAIVPEKSAQEIMERLGAINEKAFIIGDIAERKASQKQIKWI
ncbi:MAG: phosphoribosylformylglycinamidine cyclo-ligase [Proteobacteria bacterium]|nr:phosphoribosylformylglycinamidine cyclo-ligase [Pseudomonadota bacterium]MBU1569888.1 phosphoribosylformylglycinamidine cyclo-ligase [Pseudomonadota bacterium]